jgi:hypothetical protein
VRAWLRQLLICLLVLAVPLHGVAAATMGMAPMQTAPAQARDTPQVDCPHHRAVAKPLLDDGQGQQQNKGHTCGACSVCGSMGALLPSWPPLLPLDAVATHFNVTVQQIAAVASDRPDRPPRLIVR